MAHPFHGWSDAAGRVVLRGVPAGTLRVAVLTGERGAAEATVQLGAGQSAELRLSPSAP